MAVLSLRYGCATDVGRLRSQNQDRLLARDGLFLVADGMGGQPAGEVASALAVAELAGLAEPGRELDVTDLVEAVQQANARLLDEGQHDPERYGLGTTLTGVIRLADGQWAILNIGDSRVYRFADGRLEQLTTDHSAVQQLVDAGLLDPQAALHHPRRNVVTRSLGIQPPPVPDIELRRPEPGERFVICSDGLTNELSDGEIAAVLTTYEDPQRAAEALVAQAVTAGGRDNVTVIVVRLDLADTD